MSTNQIASASPVNPEDFVVHTMAKDLEQVQNPSSKPYDSIGNSSQKLSPGISTPTPATKPKTASPFLIMEEIPGEKPPVTKPVAVVPPTENTPFAPATKTTTQNPFSLPATENTQPAPFATANNTPQSIPANANQAEPERIADKWKEAVPKIIVKQEEANHVATSGKALKILIVIFLLLLIGGGFYFFYYKKTLTPAIVDPPTETPIAPPVETPVDVPPVETPTPLSISVDKPNYLSINALDNASFKEALKKYSADVLKINASTPIEFIVTDQLNNPISFADFSAKSGINLSADTIASLASSFSLFIYVDQGNPKVGLAIDIKNQTALKTALKQEEASITTKLAPLYLDLPFSTSVAKFENSKYKEVPVRFYNIISPTKLSIDYMLTTNKFIIGTTKMTTTSIYDYLIK